MHTRAKLLDAACRAMPSTRVFPAVNSRLVSRYAKLSARPNPTVSTDAEAVFGKFNAMTSEYSVELPGIEPTLYLGFCLLNCRFAPFRCCPVGKRRPQGRR